MIRYPFSDWRLTFSVDDTAMTALRIYEDANNTASTATASAHGLIRGDTAMKKNQDSGDKEERRDG